MKTKIFIENLAPDATEDDVLRYFQNYTNIVGSFIPQNKNSLKSQGFGFIEVESHQEAERVVKNLNGSILMSKTIKLSLARQIVQKTRPSNVIVERVILPKKKK